MGTELITTDASRYDWRDPYHALLALEWPALLALLVGYYLVVNLVFGALYALAPGSIANLRAGDVADAFFFSVETFATVGYGAMSPQTTYGHSVATLEIFVGLLSSAVITGLIFVRFARPRPNLVFSRNLTVAPVDGMPTLMARIGNRRTAPLQAAEATLLVFLRHEAQEGMVMWRALELPLVRSRFHAFSLAWTLMHVIDETSPICGMDTATLVARDAEFVLAVRGVDSVLAAPVHATHVWTPEQVLWGRRFADMMTVGNDGRTRVRLARLHDTVAAAQ